jgi:hypothetical protein
VVLQQEPWCKRAGVARPVATIVVPVGGVFWSDALEKAKAKAQQVAAAGKCRRFLT